MHTGPNMTAHDKRTLATAEIILIILAVIGLLVVVWLAWIRPQQRSGTIHSFAECTAAGRPIQESYPRACVTEDGQRFVDPAQNLARLEVKEWGIVAAMPAGLTGVYHTYSAADDRVTVSTRAMDTALATLSSCRGGLHTLVYERAQPGDPDASGTPYTEEALTQQGTKVRDHYYVEALLPQDLCLPDATDKNVKTIQDIQANLRTGMKNLSPM